jgi:hypothetical protein
MLAPLVEPKIKAMVLEAKTMIPLTMVAKIFLAWPSMTEVVGVIEWCRIVIGGLVYLHFNNVFDLHRVCATSVLCGLWIL